MIRNIYSTFLLNIFMLSDVGHAERDYILAVAKANRLSDVTYNNSQRQQQLVTLMNPEGKYDQVLF